MAQGIVRLNTAVSLSMTTVNAWANCDVSASVPAGATGAIFVFNYGGTNGLIQGFRKNGSADTVYGFTFSYNTSVPYYHIIVGLDSNRIFQYFMATGTTSVTAYLVGYTDSDCVMFDTKKTYSSVLNNQSAVGWYVSNMNTDLTGTGAKAAITIGSQVGGKVNVNVVTKNNGSTYAGTASPTGYDVCGVDGSNSIQAYCASASQTTASFFLLGYFKKTWNDIPNGSIIATTGTWVTSDLTSLTSTSATGAFIHLVATTDTRGARNNGSSDTITSSTQLTMPVTLDANRLFQINTTSATANYINGYFTGTYINKIVGVSLASVSKVSGVTKATTKKIAGLINN